MARHTQQDIAELARLMKKIDIAMLTTTGPNGYLVSRPLSTQAAEFDGERVWFFTEADSPKTAEIRRHPKVNLAYASKDKNTYLSAAGDARVVRDQARIDLYWNDAMKAFFPNGKDDPNLTLVEVRLRTVEYWDGPGSWLGKATAFVIARVTGNDDVLAENRIVDIAAKRSRKPPANDSRPRKTAAGVRAASRGLTAKTAPRKAAKQAARKAATRKAPVAKRPAAKRAAKKTAPKRPALARKRARR